MGGIESYEAARDLLDRQLATDYCLPEGAIGLARQFGSNLLTAERLPLENMRSDRRRYTDHWELRLAHYSGITLLSAQHPRVLQAIEEQLAGDAGAWVGDYSRLLRVNDYLSPSAMQNTGTALFFTPGRDLFRKDRRAEQQDAAAQLSQQGFSFRWLEPTECDAYRGHEFFTNAFGFSALRPDLYVLAAYSDGQPVAVAGASADSLLANQIGVDTLPDYRNRGLASYLVHELALKVLEQGQLPFYGTSPSHVLSQKVAIKAGLEPAWWEFASTSLLDIDLDRPEHNLIEGNLPS
ncbi:MAG: GNAT family N-acetyltransferase [Rothia sp. (in: high G+C Gram-positive bacteria)]|nr:GNAT family N-acetyltransferase [Rothia sp. (in: high G+C Gram-positive bacteria)]